MKPLDLPTPYVISDDSHAVPGPAEVRVCCEYPLDFILGFACLADSYKGHIEFPGRIPRNAFRLFKRDARVCDFCFNFGRFLVPAGIARYRDGGDTDRFRPAQWCHRFLVRVGPAIIKHSDYKVGAKFWGFRIKFAKIPLAVANRYRPGFGRKRIQRFPQGFKPTATLFLFRGAPFRFLFRSTGFSHGAGFVSLREQAKRHSLGTCRHTAVDFHAEDMFAAIPESLGLLVSVEIDAARVLDKPHLSRLFLRSRFLNARPEFFK